LRLRLEAILPQSLGALASTLSAARERIRGRYPDGDTRRRAIDAALQEGGALDPFAPGSADAVETWLEGKTATEETRVLDFTLTSDDPEDLTIRQARALGQADTVLHDPAIAEAILVRARADAVRQPLLAEPPASGLTVLLRRG
jgi:uroporphyrin-III C-methyltransferase/precorrin-2 dehydrogenase/sirohydrochlorin ferrochelatase